MRLFINILFLLILFSCTHSGESDIPHVQPEEPLDQAAELQAIETLRSSFSQAINEGRYEDLGKWVSKDVKTVRAGGKGWDDMYALAGSRGRFPYDSIVMTPTETVLLNDSVAYDWGTSRVYYTNDNGEAVELRDAFLVLLKKENGEWKLFREVASSHVE